MRWAEWAITQTIELSSIGTRMILNIMRRLCRVDQNAAIAQSQPMFYMKGVPGILLFIFGSTKTEFARRAMGGHIRFSWNTLSNIH
jgi:hypothetical protein